MQREPPPDATGKKFFIHTMGCQMNLADSERMAGALEASGYACTEEASEAEVLIYNTCSIRQKAENKVRFSLIFVLRVYTASFCTSICFSSVPVSGGIPAERCFDMQALLTHDSKRHLAQRFWTICIGLLQFCCSDRRHKKVAQVCRCTQP